MQVFRANFSLDLLLTQAADYAGNDLLQGKGPS
jgi:hypothetical protein